MIANARTRPSQLRSRERVTKILDAAAEVMVERGYDGATLREIATRADVKQTSMYRYWPNKQAIVSDLIDRFIAGQDVELDACMAMRESGSSINEVLASYISKLRHIVETEYWIRPCQIALISDPALKGLDEKMHAHFSDRFSSLFFTEAGDQSNHNTQTASRLLVIFLDTFVLSLNRYATLDHKAMEAEFRAVLQGLLP